MTDHALPPSAERLRDHLRRLFPTREIATLAPTRGPILRRVPGFHVLRVTPGPDDASWLYLTAGLWETTHRHGHAPEFLLAAPEASDHHVKTVTMVAYYHATGDEYELDLGHTVPIGHPWIRGSQCDRLLVSRAYLWGPRLETCPLPNGHTRILWLLPITRAEETFRHANGLEALEQRLEAAGIDPTDPHRPSVVD